tara:strand:+ start:1696 stop:2217 length:522 start_codon:yes stop_codon:yes gene_type:complete
MINKLVSGGTFPVLNIPKYGGGSIQLGGKGAWQLIIVYRGQHCPLCKIYLNKLEKLYPEFKDLGVEVVAISSDPYQKVERDLKEFKWSFSIGYDLSKSDMIKLGVYISNPRSINETDRQFPEPACFVIRPDGIAQIIEISNSPVARIELENLASSLEWIMDNEYPVRGTASLK